MRSLHLNEGNHTMVLSPEVFDEMSRSRAHLNMLPNLRSLVWLTGSVERMRHSLLFQHENITSFTIRLHKTHSYTLSTFFEEVLSRMPNLEGLDLRFRFPVREVEHELMELLAGLTMLKRVVLPVYTLTSRILKQLSIHHHLETIQFEYMDFQGSGDIQDVLDWNPQLEEGAFPALWDLSLSTKLPAITKFINNGFAPPNLKSLYIHVLAAVPVETLSHFLEVLSNNCTQLTHLYLDFFTAATIPATPKEWPRLDWAALRPLLGFPRLVSLELRWDHPLDISLGDLEEMASKWPNLETLLLNCEPMDMSAPPALDLRALLPFARYCPKLTQLGLYMNASNDVPIPKLDQIKPFSSLEELVVGGSRITDAGYVAMFLSQLCPPGCDVVWGVAWPEGFGVVETDANAAELARLQNDAKEDCERWAEVEKMLPLLTKLRVDERSVREELETEVEDLRMRCVLLADRPTTSAAPHESCVPF